MRIPSETPNQNHTSTKAEGGRDKIGAVSAGMLELEGDGLLAVGWIQMPWIYAEVLYAIWDHVQRGIAVTEALSGRLLTEA
jgi:hypothetical protein